MQKPRRRQKNGCQGRSQRNVSRSSTPSSLLTPSFLHNIDIPTTMGDAPKTSPRSKRADTLTGERAVGPKPLRSSSPKTQYLILYNFLSAIAWLVVLGRVVLLVPLVGFGRTYQGVGQFAKWTQTVALLEIVHAATGPHFPFSTSAQLHANISESQAS